MTVSKSLPLPEIRKSLSTTTEDSMDSAMQPTDADRRFWEENTESYKLFTRLFGRGFPRIRQFVREGLDEDDDVLEVAAGTGELTAGIAPAVDHLVATDYAAAMVSELEGRLDAAGSEGIECRTADIYDLPFQSDRFDAVVAGNVLHLLDDLTAGLDELCRVLRPEGILITPTFVHDETWLGWMVSRALTLADGPSNRHLDQESFHRLLADRGLSVQRTELVDGILPMAYVESIVDA